MRTTQARAKVHAQWLAVTARPNNLLVLYPQVVLVDVDLHLQVGPAADVTYVNNPSLRDDSNDIALDDQSSAELRADLYALAGTKRNEVCLIRRLVW